MDKASLLGDAIAYINELQSKLQLAEGQIKDLKSHMIASSDRSQESLSIGRGSINPPAKDVLSRRPQGSATSTPVSSGTKPIISVHILGQEAMIRISGLKDSYALAQMMMTLQERRLEVQHSNTSTVMGAIVLIVIVKVRDDIPFLNCPLDHLYTFRAPTVREESVMSIILRVEIAPKFEDIFRL